jgi:hypothetical protein
MSEPHPALEEEIVAKPPELNWELIEVYFIRSLAVFTLLRGLYNWAQIIGLGTHDFLEIPPQAQAYLSFCAILGLVSGVGLWLLNAWGRAIWLFLLIVMIIFDFLSLSSTLSWFEYSARMRLLTLFDILLVGLYFALSTQVILYNRKSVRVH